MEEDYKIIDHYLMIRLPEEIDHHSCSVICMRADHMMLDNSVSHIVFDFSDSLYGEVCSVSFFGHLRDEMKFAGLEPLVEQMGRDCEEARALLAGVTPLSEIDAKIAF